MCNLDATTKLPDLTHLGPILGGNELYKGDGGTPATSVEFRRLLEHGTFPKPQVIRILNNDVNWVPRGDGTPEVIEMCRTHGVRLENRIRHLVSLDPPRLE